MWFQRLVEIDDESDPEPTLEPTERPPAVVYNSAKIRNPKVIVSTPADFQRVRLMSILRPKEQKAVLQNQGSPMMTQDQQDARSIAGYYNPGDTVYEVAWAASLPMSSNRKQLLQDAVQLGGEGGRILELRRKRKKRRVRIPYNALNLLKIL